jgi:hypothetical protein
MSVLSDRMCNLERGYDVEERRLGYLVRLEVEAVSLQEELES